jgi:hypothetical protein
LFIDPQRVEHRSRLQFSFDPPELLAALRAEERLDDHVTGSRSDQEAWARLMVWTRAQWQPGRPDPYPPPDARIILRDVRADATGGFCAQYCFVLAQAIQSFGVPARLVTVVGHEVVEAWLRDERRWVMFDPTYRLQVAESSGRRLSALEVARAAAAGEALEFTAEDLAQEAPEAYARRFLELAVWLRNDFVGAPMNFADFDRYRAWFDPAGSPGSAVGGLRTPHELDLYPDGARWVTTSR